MAETKAEKPKNRSPKSYKAQLLICAYMQGITLEEPRLKAEQEYILVLAPRILSFIIELSMEYTMFCKLIGLRAIKFSQYFFQVMNMFASISVGLGSRRFALSPASAHDCGDIQEVAKEVQGLEDALQRLHLSP